MEVSDYSIIYTMPYNTHILNISAIPVPAIGILASSSVQCPLKTTKDFSIIHLCHRHSYVVSISVQIILHKRKGELNWIEVG